MRFKGQPPGSGSGDMSRRTQALRPSISLTATEARRARTRRRKGESPVTIAAHFNVPVEEVEKVLLQMRSPRPETTRGTLNVTLAAHAFVMDERQGREPLWVTMDRLFDELIRLRGQATSRSSARRRAADAQDDLLPGLLPDRSNG